MTPLRSPRQVQGWQPYRCDGLAQGARALRAGPWRRHLDERGAARRSTCVCSPRHVKPVASADDDQIRLGKNGVKVLVGLAQRVVERGAEQMVPSIMEKTGLSREDAHLIFVHNVQGNLAVNRLLGWKRGPEFAHAQELLGAYSEGGLQAVSSLHDSRCSS